MMWLQRGPEGKGRRATAQRRPATRDGAGDASPTPAGSWREDRLSVPGQWSSVSSTKMHKQASALPGFHPPVSFLNIFVLYTAHSSSGGAGSIPMLKHRGRGENSYRCMSADAGSLFIKVHSYNDFCSSVFGRLLIHQFSFFMGRA